MSEALTASRPMMVRLRSQDSLEYVSRNVATIAQPHHGQVWQLLDMNTREVIGFRIEGWNDLNDGGSKV